MFMSKLPNKRNYRSYGAFQSQMKRLIDEYEQQLGRLPIWLPELNAERIASLLACCIRIGMPLPIEDALEADDVDRKTQALKGLRRARGET
jgi:hypothetical protein